LYNDKNGGFSTENSGILQVEGHDIRAFSMFASAAAREGGAPSTRLQRLAFVTEEGLYIARGNALDDVTKLEGFDDARAVTVTDPNGDKIEDIAVADAAGLWLVEAQLR
jgi:hypothetical protein